MLHVQCWDNLTDSACLLHVVLGWAVFDVPSFWHQTPKSAREAQVSGSVLAPEAGCQQISPRLRSLQRPDPSPSGGAPSGFCPFPPLLARFRCIRSMFKCCLLPVSPNVLPKLAALPNS